MQNLEIRTNSKGERAIVNLDDLDANGRPAVVEFLGKEEKPSAASPVAPKVIPQATPQPTPVFSPQAVFPKPPVAGMSTKAEGSDSSGLNQYLINAGVEAIPSVTGMALSPLGPLASIAGYTGASAISRELRDRLGIPQEKGKGGADEALLILGEAGLNFAGDKVGDGVTALGMKGFKGAKDAIYRKLADRSIKKGVKLSPDTMQLLREDPDFPITLGQAKGKGTIMDIGEGMLAPELKDKTLGIQQSKLQTKLAAEAMKSYPMKVDPSALSPGKLEKMAKAAEQKTIFPEDIAKMVRENVRGGYAKISKLEDRLWEDFRGSANAVKMESVLPLPNGQIEKSVIEGPISPNVSRNTARQYLADINKAYNKTSAEEIYPMLVEEQKPLYNALLRIATGDGALDMKVLTDLKRISGSKGYRNAIPNGIDEAGFRRLNSEIDGDIRKGIESWDVPQHYKDQVLRNYKRANAITSKKKAIFTDINEVENMRESPLSGISDVQALFRDPNILKRTIQGSKDPGAMRRALAAQYITDFQQRISSGGEFIPGNIAVNELMKTSENLTRDTLIPPAQMKRLKMITKTISDLTERSTAQGQGNLALREGNAGVSIAGGVVEDVFKGSATKALLSSGAKQLAVIVGFREFIENVALNPQVSREVLQLAKLKPEDPRAKVLGKRIAGALKGIRVGLQTPEGVLPAVIDSNGTLQTTIPEEANQK